MPAEKFIHITLKMNVPVELAEGACKGPNRLSAQALLRATSEGVMGELLAAWERDGSPYGPAEKPIEAPGYTPTKIVVEGPREPSVKPQDPYEECLACQ